MDENFDGIQYKEVNTAVIKEFKKRKKRQVITTIPVIAIILIGFIIRITHPELSNARIDETSFLGIPGIVICIIVGVIIIGSVIFSFLNWRCPACKAYLGKNTDIKFCPKCGTKFE
ncbi:hypothetical protein OW763_07020 [Clostridium aestuarii]|uniref:Zinc ribbon domain-containing protein n=1 Tax=Clostridium aestuarii TaxID=338193 RepID=A0ABT4D253_9CLOT|nr:hypothetical protein [Clostridium aestuarii]MCY6484103.1 hypothetical protein [Clostridium aestuarii]